MAETNIIGDTAEKLNEAFTEAAPHLCKRCGWDQREEYSLADSNLVQAYFKCLLMQQPFQKTYELFNGTLIVVFEEPTGKLLRLQEREANKRADNKTQTISDALDFAVIPTLVSIHIKNEEFGNRELYIADRMRREQILQTGEIPEELDNMPVVTLQALRNAYSEFSALCAQLVRAAQDENFWKGAGRN